MSLSALSFRELHTPEEMQQVVQLQFDTWGPADATPANQLTISVKAGGHVLGAFDGDELVAFSYGFPGVRPGQEPWLASHMLGTRAQYRGRGLGRRLKWLQRDWALARGFRRITWTFDPLEARNAHLNINLLGAVAREYIVNCYGEMDDKLNHGLPSDRLMAEWDLESPRVLAARNGAPTAVKGGARKVAIPRDFQALKAQDLGAAREVRLRLRAELQHEFAQGRVIVGYDREDSSFVLAESTGTDPLTRRPGAS